MDISFNCEKCGQNIVIDETGAGQLVDCPKCGRPLEVPRQITAPIVSVPPPPQRQPPSSVMKWEYKTIKVQTKGIVTVRFDEAQLDHTMNALGLQGWELVAAIPLDIGAAGGTMDVIVIFKRPKT